MTSIFSALSNNLNARSFHSINKHRQIVYHAAAEGFNVAALCRQSTEKKFRQPDKIQFSCKWLEATVSTFRWKLIITWIYSEDSRRNSVVCFNLKHSEWRSERCENICDMVSTLKLQWFSIPCALVFVCIGINELFQK